MNSNKKAFIHLNQTLDGKREKILTIECHNCLDNDRTFFKNKNCFECFFKNIYHNKNVNFKLIQIEKLKNPLKIQEIIPLIEYFRKLKKFKIDIENIINYKNKKCPYQNFKCENLFEFNQLLKKKDEIYYDIILFYEEIQRIIKILIKLSPKNDACQKCISYIKNSLNLLINGLKKLELIKFYNELMNNQNIKFNSFDFYKIIFFKHLIDTPDINLLDNNLKSYDKELIEDYIIGEYDLFKISIYNVLNETEKRYQWDLSISKFLEKEYLDSLIDNLLKDLEIIKLDKVYDLEDLISLYNQKIEIFINKKYAFSEREKKKIAFLSTIKKLHLLKLFPLLIDDFIEEIFIDSPNDEIYINHQIYGRCRTGAKLNLKDIERFKTMLRLYSGKRLDYANPSIKYVIKNKYFYCRFAIDVRPVHINNFALDIRKLNKNIFTIQDLLKKKTLDPLMASFIYFCLLRRVNFTVTGETDTGKTTFINAFDLITPKEFRKIYVENIEESLNEIEFDKHQLKYQADSLEDHMIEKFSKSSYIKMLLHRTPDLIYLGEILTREEAEAMFHCLAAGLRGFQTIHSNSINSLINRFLYHFKIDFSCLDDLGLIILLKKDFNRRRIQTISEIRIDNSTINDYHQNIFEYNPELEKWNLIKDLYETLTITKIKKFEYLSIEKFENFLNLYYKIFDFLLISQKIENKDLVQFFHQISYLSTKSFNNVASYWERWKKIRSLNL